MTYELVFANSAGDFNYTATFYNRQKAIDMVNNQSFIIEDVVDTGDGEVWYVFPNVWNNSQDQVS